MATKVAEGSHTEEKRDGEGRKKIEDISMRDLFFCKAGVDVVKQILKTQPAVKTAVPPASGIVRKKEMFGK